MKKKKRLRKVGIALLVVCGLAAFANSFSDHNKNARKQYTLYCLLFAFG